MNEGRIADAEHEEVGEAATGGPLATRGAEPETGKITCRECGDEGVRADHREQVVIACPSCREILYRPVGRSEPAL